jgi:hypothetical protein
MAGVTEDPGRPARREQEKTREVSLLPRRIVLSHCVLLRGVVEFYPIPDVHIFK